MSEPAVDALCEQADNPLGIESDMVHSLEQALRRRAAEHVIGLHVNCSKNALVVRGESNSYYGLQLVIEAVRPFMEGDVGTRVTLDVVVRRPAITSRPR